MGVSMHKTLLRIGLVVASVSACAPATGSLPPEDAATADARSATDSATMTDGTTGDVANGEYPAGPYGSSVGNTLANLAFEGFVNEARTEVSTSVPFVPYSFARLREGGARYALVHTSGFL